MFDRYSLKELENPPPTFSDPLALVACLVGGEAGGSRGEVVEGGG